MISLTFWNWPENLHVSHYRTLERLRVHSRGAWRASEFCANHPSKHLIDRSSLSHHTPVPQRIPRRRLYLPYLYHYASDRKRGAVSPLKLPRLCYPLDDDRCPRDWKWSRAELRPYPLSWGRFLVCAGRGEGGTEMDIWVADGVLCLLCFAGINSEGGICCPC